MRARECPPPSRLQAHHRFDDHGIAADLGAIAHQSHLSTLAPALTTTSRPAWGWRLAPFVQRGSAQGHAPGRWCSRRQSRPFRPPPRPWRGRRTPTFNLGAGVDFNAREPARKVRNEAPQPFQPAAPAPVRRPVQPDGVQAGVTGDHLPGAARSQGHGQDALDIGAQAGKHGQVVVGIWKRSLALYLRRLDHGFGDTTQDVDFFRG